MVRLASAGAGGWADGWADGWCSKTFVELLTEQFKQLGLKHAKQVQPFPQLTAVQWFSGSGRHE